MTEYDLEGDLPLNAEQQAIVNALTGHQLERIDDALLAACVPTWRKAARVVGEAMLQMPDRPRGVSDAFFAERVKLMVQQGQLESSGDPHGMRTSEVRLPA